MTLDQARELARTRAELLWLAPATSITTGKVLVGVRVHDARVSYGRTQLLVQPTSGRGHRWIDADLTQEIED
ncbi:hypothetical protein ACG83_10460 [Frankia sp. R43]|uniref:hypothetical protein n=1 Tax=Frankia sp. R43 TaxID=269536 RepID=UPI0006CA25A4|nr:hypothetical protein [Frankia sp. R43]KPM55697.1 hypothetical protein ACG83_10460 [Frankia sp. R43]